MVRLPARVIGVGIETADMLVHEILSRNLRDRKAVARYAGLTGSPDESGAQRHRSPTPACSAAIWMRPATVRMGIRIASPENVPGG
jgi:transposase